VGFPLKCAGLIFFILNTFRFLLNADQFLQSQVTHERIVSNFRNGVVYWEMFRQFLADNLLRIGGAVSGDAVDAELQLEYALDLIR
jgi:hypothetical protein